jgi:hypothetical protein
MGPREIKQKRERDMSPERNEFILEEKKLNNQPCSTLLLILI